MRMSMEEEQQSEEMEVLLSIYDGDANFNQLDDKTYQYKFTEGLKSFILEVSWGPRYPAEKPKLNLDIFYNEGLLATVRRKILAVADEEAEHWLGYAMTYSIFECVREKLTELLAEQPILVTSGYN